VTQASVSLPSADAFRGRLPRSLDGQTVLIHFSGSWCKPCRGEIPLLQRLADETDVQVVEVSRDRHEKSVDGVLNKTGADFTTVLDPDGEYMRKFSDAIPEAMPSSVLVIDGTVVAAHMGAFLTWSDLTTDRPRA